MQNTSHLRVHGVLAAHSDHRENIRHGDFHGLGKVKSQRDIDGQLAYVEERRREGRREETQLVLEHTGTGTGTDTWTDRDTRQVQGRKKLIKIGISEGIKSDNNNNNSNEGKSLELGEVYSSLQ